MCQTGLLAKLHFVSISFSSLNVFVKKKTLSEQHYCIEWGPKKLADLDFVNNFVLVSQTLVERYEMTNNLRCNAAKGGASQNTLAVIVVGKEKVLALSNNGRTEFVDVH